MCMCTGHAPVPLNNEQRFKFAMSTYSRAASHCDQRWTCVLWNQGVKWSQASSQPTPEWTKINQPNWPTNQHKTQQQQQHQQNK